MVKKVICYLSGKLLNKHTRQKNMECRLTYFQMHKVDARKQSYMYGECNRGIMIVVVIGVCLMHL